MIVIPFILKSGGVPSDSNAYVTNLSQRGVDVILVEVRF